jgi:hypothetical protein
MRSLPVNHLKPTTPRATSLSKLIRLAAGCMLYTQETAPYVNASDRSKRFLDRLLTEPKIAKRQVCSRLLYNRDGWIFEYYTAEEKKTKNGDTMMQETEVKMYIIQSNNDCVCAFGEAGLSLARMVAMILRIPPIAA